MKGPGQLVHANIATHSPSKGSFKQFEVIFGPFASLEISLNSSV